jgi:hypothetical protein
LDWSNSNRLLILIRFADICMQQTDVPFFSGCWIASNLVELVSWVLCDFILFVLKIDWSCLFWLLVVSIVKCFAFSALFYNDLATSLLRSVYIFILQAIGNSHHHQRSLHIYHENVLERTSHVDAADLHNVTTASRTYVTCGRGWPALSHRHNNLLAIELRVFECTIANN